MAIPGIIGTILALLTRNPKVGLFFAKYVFCYALFPISFSRLSIHGADKIDWSKTYLFISNHQSLVDIPSVFIGAKKYLYFLTKMELKKTPFVGWLGRAVGMIFIDRKNSEAAKRTIKHAGEQIKKGKNIISFAEGTRTKTGEIGRFKKGSFTIALENDIDIIPIRIFGAREILPSGTLKLRPGHVHVYFGELIKTSDFDRKKPEELADFTRNKVTSIRHKNRA